MATSLGSLRSTTQYPSSSSSIHGFCIYTNFYYEVLEPGKTKVTWSFQAGYDNYGNYPATSTYASAGITISLSATKGSISEITGTSYSGSKVFYKNWPTLSNGSCIITHDASGAASFNIYADVSVGGWDCDSSGSLNVPTNIPYTACGAPTSVSASGIVKTDGSFTISWSGATNGVSNKIKAYQVYWYATSNGAAPTASAYSGTQQVDVTDGTTSGSYTVKLNSATRGHKVVCGVKALSELNNSAFDSGIKTGGLVTINSLPGAPSASVNKTIVPSTNGQVTFTITAGADNDSSQTKTLYYSTSPTGSKTKITSPWSPTVSATTTYYFWTYDGLEYSSSSSAGITITKNTKPTFDVSISAQGLASINNNSGYNYTVTPTISISNISGGQSNKKYIYKLLYGTNTSTSSSKILYNLDAATQKTITDIRNEVIGHENNGAYYRISVQCYDGIEYSDVKNTDIRYVTKIPSLIGVYNNSNFSNISGFYNGNFATHYSKFLGFVFQRDAGYNTLKFKNYDDSVKTISLSTNSSDTRGSWTNNDEPTESKLYNLSYQIGYSSGYTYSQITQNITKIGKVILSNFQFGRSLFQFFTDSGTYANTVGHSYSAAPLSNGALKKYGIATYLSSSSLLGQIYTNNKWSNVFSLEPNSNTTNNSTIGFNVTSTLLSNLVSNLFTSAQKNTNYNSTFRLYIKNDFGDQSYIDSNFTISFISNDSIELRLKNIYPSADPDLNNIDKWMYLKEGMEKLIGKFEIASYNTNPKGEIQILRSTESSWQSLGTFSFNNNSNIEATPGNPAIYKASNILIQTIGEISNLSYSINYRLIVNTDGGSKTFALYNNIPVRGHVPAALFIKNTNYDATGNGRIVVDYEITNWGSLVENLKLGNNEDKKILLYVGNTQSATQFYTYNNSLDFFKEKVKSTTFIYKIDEDTDSILVKMCFYTELGTYLKSDAQKTKVYFKTSKIPSLQSLNFFPVFNTLPTVAYRKNHLGINVLNPSSSDKNDAIIVIGETSGRNKIYFQPAGENLCVIENFHIDGGTW